MWIVQVHALEVREDVNRVLFALAPAATSVADTTKRLPAAKAGGTPKGSGKGNAAALRRKLAVAVKQHVLTDGSRGDTASDIVDMLDNLHAC